MNPTDRDNDLHDDELTEPLASAIAAVRDESVDPARVRQAADRVWARLAASASAPQAPAASAAWDQSPQAPAASAAWDQTGAIAGCAGYQALIPAYLAGDLADARTMLLEDHVRECIPCRRALAAARSGQSGTPGLETTASRARGLGSTPRSAASRRWLPLAAVLALAIGLVAYLAAGRYFAAAAGPATIAAVDGALLRVAALSDGTAAAPADADSPLAGERRLAVGEQVSPREVVRTAKGSRAVVRLADGSSIELDERTQLSFAGGWGGTTLRLDRGNVIVEAAEQGPGRHLYVATGDCKVSVVGTVFAVDHGVKGSRVSVLAGEVRVAQGGRDERVLRPGDQLTTRAGLTGVPVADEFAWSRNVDRYTEMIRELAALRQAIRERVTEPGLRYESRLAGAVPAGTVAYIALPNLSGQLAESYQVLQERLAVSPLLARWWSEQAAAGGRLEEAVTRLHDFGGYLGDEVVVALGAGGQPGDLHGEGVVILAEAARPGLRAYLEQEVARINAEAGHPALALVDDPEAGTSSPSPDGHPLLLWTGDGLFVAATDPATLATAVATAAGNAPGFAGSGLDAQVQAAYADGVEWLFAGDLGSLLAHAGESPEDRAEMERLGLSDLRYLLIEHRSGEERGTTSAELIVGETRRGVLSWLAAPGPMGSLEFVSPQAALAAAFVVKRPAEMVDDLTALLADDPSDGHGLADFEAETGIDLRDDLAAALGGEVAFALDGPLAPSPSWKVVVEVYDPARLQATIERAVERADAEARSEGHGGLALDSEQAGGRTYYRVRHDEGEIHYLYVDGYLLAAANRALLDRTLAERAAGTSLASSAEFRRLLPADRHTDFSAVFYQHVAPILAPLAGEIARLAGGGEDGPLSPEQARALEEMARDTGPTLACAWGETDRIRFAGSSPFGPFDLGGPGLFGLGALGGLAQLGEATAISGGER